ncbi:hypothetical protein AMEX_G11348 [Astyanax mexicanus]|uniref:Ubiquitin-like domain-containing protein n=1 Tax=Astyanax mexicanus TaxID=7994 RepID=A0A8T2LRB5_ASTMX|nr:hypothetical protein AMEX_G11348 [Astyanax mexicanus]
MEGRERLSSMKNIFEKKYHAQEVKNVQQAKDSGPQKISPTCTENGIKELSKDQSESRFTSGSSPCENSSAYFLNSTDSLPWTQSQDITANTQKTETAISSSVTPDYTDDLYKMSINVTCVGQSKIFFIFPAEKISVLLQEACDWAKKKPEKMNLVFDGEQLDVMKAVSEHPNLRGGSKVNLIRAS